MKWTKTAEGYQCGEYSIRAIREWRSSRRGSGKSVHYTVYVTAFRGVEFGFAEEKLADAKAQVERHANG